MKYPLFSKARRYECSLKAGDVLFIPGKNSGPLWLDIYKYKKVYLLYVSCPIQDDFYT